MEWDKKIIEKPVEKEKSALATRAPSIIKKFKPVMLLKNIRANTFNPMDYQTRRLRQAVLLNAERKKAKAFTLIRRTSFV